MSEPQPQMNAPESRTATGEILDQSTPPTPNQDSSTPTEGTAETKPETKAEAKPEAKPEVKAEPVAATYEPFKLPEGMKLEGETLTKAQDLFKSLNLNQAQAQSLVDFHSAQLQAVAKAPENAFNELHNQWKTASEADPEIGPKAKQIRETLGKAYATIGDPKLVEDFKHAMNLTGVGDHPAFIKVMTKLAAQVVEGAPVRAGGPAPVKAPGEAPKSIASALYPNLS